MNLDSWRPFIAKILGPIIGAVIASFILWLKARWNVEVSLSSQEMTELINHTIDMMIFAISAGVSAVTLNKKVNPGNAASSHLAAREKYEVQVIKAKTGEYEAQK